MMKEFIFLCCFSASLCVAQSSLTTPSADVQQNSEEAPAQNNSRSPMQGSAQQGTYPQNVVPDLSRDVNQLPLTTNPALQVRPENRPSRIVGPLRTKSEFQQYAEDATGRQLPVYGRQLFDQVPSTFAPLENVPVPADYVLGPGDQLLVRAWGKIELNSRLTIDRNGQISLPRVGTVTVSGLKYSQVESYLRSSIGALFKDFELNVTLGQLRTIQIYVLGNARQPGAYTVSALSTLVDALFSSGGPSATGTMRDIQLRRDGQTVSDFDLYDLVAKGDKSKDVRLLPGDVIFVPAIGPQVAVSGDVNQPGIYELKGATSAGTVVATAGGMTSLASVERAVLERIENHSNRMVEEFGLDDQGQTRELKDGDILRIYPLSPKFGNAVTLRGNVAVPGLYRFKEGMRVSDLIPSREALITRDYWNRQNHLVQPISQRPFSVLPPCSIRNRIPNTNNRGTQTGSGVTSNQVSPSVDNTTGSNSYENYDYSNCGDISDNPNYPQDYSNNGMGVSTGRGTYQNSLQGGPTNGNGSNDTNRGTDALDSQGQTSAPDAQPGLPGTSKTRAVELIGQNSAEINWEYALIERLDDHDLSTHLIPFRLASAIDNPASPDNQLLKPGDVVTIFSRADLELPMDKHASFIRVAGEVNAPGIYRVNPGDTLKDVVKMAGGLTQHSYLYASIFTRVSTRQAQEAELRQSTEQMQRDMISKFANTVPAPGQTGSEQQAQLAMQQSLLARLAAIKPTGRVVLSMKPDAQDVADIPDFPLEDGDSLYIPPRLSTVQVAGAVYNANAFRYSQGERLASYLNAAGGATRDADTKRMFVIRADGSVVSRQERILHSHGSYQNLRLLPGDAIVVPEKLRTSSTLNEFVLWTQLASQLALTAAALNVIK